MARSLVDEQELYDSIVGLFFNHLDEDATNVYSALRYAVETTCNMYGVSFSRCKPIVDKVLTNVVEAIDGEVSAPIMGDERHACCN